MKLKKEGARRRRGLTCGTFDLCHAGHIIMFQECKTVCDYLIVGLQSDPTIDRPNTKNKPIMSVEERLIILRAIKYIDEIVLYDTEAELREILETNAFDIDVRFVGSDWNLDTIDQSKFAFDWYVNSRDHEYSSTRLRKQIYEAEKILYETCIKPASQLARRDGLAEEWFIAPDDVNTTKRGKIC